jgi:hypothetical protein
MAISSVVSVRAGVAAVFAEEHVYFTGPTISEQTLRRVLR